MIHDHALEAAVSALRALRLARESTAALRLRAAESVAALIASASGEPVEIRIGRVVIARAQDAA